MRRAHALGMRKLLCVLLFTSTAHAGALDFSSCPDDETPLGVPTGSESLNLTVTPSGPQAPQTWFGTKLGFSHHWVFVTTNSGVSVADYNSFPFFSGMSQFTHGSVDLEKAKDADGTDLLLVTTDNDAGHSVLRVVELSWISPTSSTVRGNVNLDNSWPDASGTMIGPCSVAGAHADSNRVTATSIQPGLAFVVNECTGDGSGSVDAIDLQTMQVVQRVRLDKAPTGIGLDNVDETRLYVTNEKAGSFAASVGGLNTSGTPAGSLITFAVHRFPTSAQHFLEPKSAVNAGCSPVRLALDGAGHVAVSARASNNVVVFDRTQLVSSPDTARMGRVRVGKSPVDLKFISNGTLLAVANSDRFFDGTSGTAKTSISIFKTSQILSALSPGTRALVPSCSLHKTPNTNSGTTTDFPRNFAADDQRLYVTLAKNSFVQFFFLSDLQLDCL